MMSFRIETREMFADDLTSGVALDSLCTSVPTLNPALGIEHEYCVIDDTLNQLLCSGLGELWVSVIFVRHLRYLVLCTHKATEHFVPRGNSSLCL